MSFVYLKNNIFWWGCQLCFFHIFFNFIIFLTKILKIIKIFYPKFLYFFNFLCTLFAD
ncbi:hypothetical protein ANACOL_01231 [Anaerotruncus colihominis DSM 17241]|uniref:Uncharacterized protein n=1 Tax=Anaerotruncus colihominis DSM 17241 TaxID=445972 RepID=B0P8Y5_9FIRM|nr:hypothetical protein ANACOL_01231 [Anaerotruncus colihominis DSM 17241]